MGGVVEVDEGAGVEAFSAFPAGGDEGIVGGVGGGFEDAVFFDQEIDARLEEESAREEGSFGDEQGAAAGGGETVDFGLDGFGVDGFAVGDGAGIGDGDGGFGGGGAARIGGGKERLGQRGFGGVDGAWDGPLVFAIVRRLVREEASHKCDG